MMLVSGHRVKVRSESDLCPCLAFSREKEFGVLSVGLGALYPELNFLHLECFEPVNKLVEADSVTLERRVNCNLGRRILGRSENQDEIVVSRATLDSGQDIATISLFD